MATEWNKILNDHRKGGLALIGGIVISDENLNDPDGFRNEVSSFMDEYDMFHGTKQIIHHGGKPDETDLSIEMSADGLTMVRIDGRHAMSTEANALAYDAKTGACMAMNIDIDGTRTLLNSTPAGTEGPKDCFAMAYTSAGARIVVEFQPSGSDVLIKGAIFQADIK